jgi:hypothetical protein
MKKKSFLWLAHPSRSIVFLQQKSSVLLVYGYLRMCGQGFIQCVSGQNTVIKLPRQCAPPVLQFTVPRRSKLRGDKAAQEGERGRDSKGTGKGEREEQLRALASALAAKVLD